MTTKKEIRFNTLSAADILVIKTRSSVYHFLVTDPLLRIGILSGGSLDREMPAVLVGMWRKTQDVWTSNAPGLQTESRALFWLNSASGVQQLVSSAVTDVVHLKATK